MAAIKIKTVKTVDVKYLFVSAHVRYWDDAFINGTIDTAGTLTPFRNGNCWEPLIDIEKGSILDWPDGVVADIHFKVCDEGTYKLAGRDLKIVKQIDGYVPKIMCPEENGYGDYIIMKIDGSGKINKWVVDLSDFSDEGKDENI